jgi:hypothetical protein
MYLGDCSHVLLDRLLRCPYATCSPVARKASIRRCVHAKIPPKTLGTHTHRRSSADTADSIFNFLSVSPSHRRERFANFKPSAKT